MEAEVEEAAPKKSKKKLIMIVAGVFVLAGGAYMFLGGGGGDAEASVTTTTVVVEGPVLEADQMTVNLAGESTMRYARIKFAVVLPEGGDTAAVGERFPLLKDAVLDVVTGYTAEDLLAPDALDALREEFTSAAQVVWENGEVLRVVITEVLVQ